jgi:hypothetical protein
MAQYKGTLFFQATPNGWTERYFMNASTLSDASAALLSVIVGRLPILHEDCSIVAATLSDIAIRGDSFNVLSVGEVGSAVDTTGYVDVDNALLIKWQVGVFQRNKTFLRGIPNGQQRDGVYAPSLPYIALVNTYAGDVLANCVFPAPGPLNPSPPPKYLYSYVPGLSYSLKTRLARRKSGRPFGLPRGRRVAP